MCLSLFKTYKKPPRKTFRNHCPKKHKLLKCVHSHQIDTLKNLIKQCNNSWQLKHKLIASRTIYALTRGVRTPVYKDLPGVVCKNANSAIRNGEIMRDAIATWLTTKFVAGRFDNPPHPQFRANMLMAKEERTKVHPIGTKFICTKRGIF